MYNIASDYSHSEARHAMTKNQALEKMNRIVSLINDVKQDATTKADTTSAPLSVDYSNAANFLETAGDWVESAKAAYLNQGR